MNRRTFGRFRSGHDRESSTTFPVGGARRPLATSCTPVSDWLLWPYQMFFPTTCFLVGWAEREQWLNAEGLVAHWAGAAAAGPRARLPRGDVA